MVHYAADLNCADEDGETALHLTLHRLNSWRADDSTEPAAARADDISEAATAGAVAGVSAAAANTAIPATEAGLGVAVAEGVSEGIAASIGAGAAAAATNAVREVLDKYPVIESIMAGFPEGTSIWLGVACLLVQRGASVTALNSRGVSPLQSVTDLTVLQAIQAYTVADAATGAINNSTRLDLDMKALDLAAESLRSTVLLDSQPNITMESLHPSSSSATCAFPSLPPPLPPMNPTQFSAAGVSSTNPFMSGSVAPCVPPLHRSTSQPASPARFAAGASAASAALTTAPLPSSTSQPASPAHAAAAQQVNFLGNI